MNEKALNEVKESGQIIHSRFKGVAFYLMILVVVSLMLVGVRFNSKNSLVIYAQQIDKPDFIQVFFPIDDVYSEENSERSAVIKYPKNGIKITLPRTPISHVRIDPANDATRVLISKIELNYLFGTETYTPKDLALYSKPIQMIDKLEITPAGLVVHSMGNDPIFELQLNFPSLSSQLVNLCLISVLLSLVVFWTVIKFKGEKLRLLALSLNVYLLVQLVTHQH